MNQLVHTELNNSPRQTDVKKRETILQKNAPSKDSEASPANRLASDLKSAKYEDFGGSGSNKETENSQRSDYSKEAISFRIRDHPTVKLSPKETEKSFENQTIKVRAIRKTTESSNDKKQKEQSQKEIRNALEEFSLAVPSKQQELQKRPATQQGTEQKKFYRQEYMMPIEMTGEQMHKVKTKPKLLVGTSKKNFIYERRDESARAKNFFGNEVKVAPTPISKRRNSDIDDFILYCNQHATVNDQKESLHSRQNSSTNQANIVSIREEIVQQKKTMQKQRNPTKYNLTKFRLKQQNSVTSRLYYGQSKSKPIHQKTIELDASILNTRKLSQPHVTTEPDIESRVQRAPFMNTFQLTKMNQESPCNSVNRTNSLFQMKIHQGLIKESDQ